MDRQRAHLAICAFAKNDGLAVLVADIAQLAEVDLVRGEAVQAAAGCRGPSISAYCMKNKE